MMNMDEKGQLRKLALLKREGLSEAEREEKSAAIVNQLLRVPQLESAKIIMCYRSFRSEVDTEKIVENFWREGKVLCFPLCEKAGIMHALAPNDESAWKKSSFGIMEPVRENSRLIAPEEIDLVICPIVAFDGKKRRMGYGGGYYDRYLPMCQKAITIGIAFEAQRLEEVPTDEHDMAMDIIITEEKIY